VVTVIAAVGMVIGLLLFVELADIASRQQVAYSHPHQPSDYARNKQDWTAQVAAVTDWLDRHREWINVISTLFIAGFTGTLWGATKRLWRTSQMHAEHMERSVGVAEKAATAAKDGAAAAENSAKIAEAAMIAAERAYVSVKSVRLIGVSNSVGNIIELNAVIIFENTGNTPTRNMIYHSSMKIFDADIPEGFDFPDFDQRQPRRSFIAPKTWVGAFNFTISRAELDAAQPAIVEFSYGDGQITMIRSPELQDAEPNFVPKFLSPEECH
jgi:hypothetical protein